MYCELVACRFPVLACQTVFFFFRFFFTADCSVFVAFIAAQNVASLSVSVCLSQCMRAHKFRYTNTCRPTEYGHALCCMSLAVFGEACFIVAHFV